MIFKNKYLPMKNTEISKIEVEYLIKKINYWLFFMEENYKYNFFDQSIFRWFSNKEILKRFKENMVAEQLDKILKDLEYSKLFNKRVILSDDDFRLINNVYKKMKLSFLPYNLRHY